MIFILRVAQLHVGLRTSYSAFDTFKIYALQFQTIQTAAWYSFSAWLFSEIYIWSAAKSADLNRIKLIPKTDRPTINERPIYLTSCFFFVALVQTGFHLFYDYDRIDMPVTKTKPESPSDQRAHLIVPPAVQLRTKMPLLALSAAKRAVAITIIFPLIYTWGIGIPYVWTFDIRRFAWSFTRTWARIFWSLPKSSALPSIKPFHVSVLYKSCLASFLLIMLWEVGNAAFSAYVAQEPLKNERPITYESRDPNGSLLTGLKGKKLQTRVSSS